MRRAAVVALLSVGMLVMASCAPPTPTAPLSGLQQFCFPADQFPLASLEITPVDVPAGASMSVRVSWIFNDGSEANENFYPVNDLVAGQPVTVNPAVPDVGRCVRVQASPGLTYQVVVHRQTELTNYLAWVNDILTPGTIWGFAPF